MTATLMMLPSGKSQDDTKKPMTTRAFGENGVSRNKDQNLFLDRFDRQTEFYRSNQGTETSQQHCIRKPATSHGGRSRRYESIISKSFNNHSVNFMPKAALPGVEPFVDKLANPSSERIPNRPQTTSKSQDSKRVAFIANTQNSFNTHAQPKLQTEPDSDDVIKPKTSARLSLIKKLRERRN